MSEFLGTVTIAIVLWYGGTLILSANSPIDAPTFIYYLVIFYSIINPAKDLSKSVYAIQKGLAPMERVDKILKAETDIHDPEHPKKIALKEKISYKDVWFKYQEAWVLKGINLDIRKGTTVALVGQSGSGKSTLVDLLPRFYDVNKGNIRIDDTDIREATLFDLRGLMGNVNQEAILFNDTFFNNIAFGVEGATMEQVEEAARIAAEEAARAEAQADVDAMEDAAAAGTAGDGEALTAQIQHRPARLARDGLRPARADKGDGIDVTHVGKGGNVDVFHRTDAVALTAQKIRQLGSGIGRGPVVL